MSAATRWAARVLLLVIAMLLAVGSGISVAQAAEGDRTQISGNKLTDRPWRGIALVTVGDRVVCTGFIVAPRKVVTAAHCLTRNAAKGDFKFKKGLPERVRVYRGYSRAAGGTSYRSCDVSKLWAHSKFIKRDKQDSAFGSRAHDYAVLTTKSGCSFPQNAVMRMWATESGDGQLGTGQKIRLAGYPADPRFGGMNGLNLWRTEGKTKASEDPRMLTTSGFVAQGMSGGPVWRSYGENSPCGRSQCVVGIVTECQVNAKGLCKLGNSSKLSVRITPAVKSSIKRR